MHFDPMVAQAERVRRVNSNKTGSDQIQVLESLLKLHKTIFTELFKTKIGWDQIQGFGGLDCKTCKNCSTLVGLNRENPILDP